MGKTQNTGRLTNGIFQDSSNNIAIGDSTASGYKFKVTGTSNIKRWNWQCYCSSCRIHWGL